jgi:hypothetical protein
MTLTGGKVRTRRETCLSATLSSTNPTWTEPGANPGLSCDRPATNRVSKSKPEPYHGLCVMLGKEPGQAYISEGMWSSK